MNKVYRVVWNHAVSRFVVASEFAKGRVKSANMSPHKTDKRPGLTLGALSWAVLLILASGAAWAAGPIFHDGDEARYSDEEVITSAANSAGYGVYALNDGGKIDFVGGSITTSGVDAAGAAAANGGVTNIDNTRIITTGLGGSGVQANVGGQVSVKNSTINTTAKWGRGIVTAGGMVAATDTTIETTGENAYGLDSASGGHISFKNGSITTSGKAGIGALANGIGNTITIEDSTIKVAGRSAPGVYTVNSGEISLINSNVTSTLTHSLQADSNSVINFNGGTIDNLSGSDALFARGGGVINIANATVNTAGRTFQGTSNTKFSAENVVINSSGGQSAIFGYAYSEIDLKDVQINLTARSQNAIYLRDHSSAKLNNVEINAKQNREGIVLGGDA